ncbi:hypothetical protein L0P88_04325 [Muricauda sp. SCSIO 64092]|uniref:hypothetical protein n=1 Tax=Allomuricauda sp. SCSIO 64092 TaxID=2908842 RepID=UPI001FF2602A|nr:hypothetical protein [Muricauda sp. SCSIO 64092]UOY07781.1 hypothetical protein L0P88_04325 [Muricauda sp. SCSIO 64092]
MRIAKDDEWVKLSEWKKIEIKNDTLHFETFGEWKDSSKVLIKYTERNKIRLLNLDNSEGILLEPIEDYIDFENPEEFWNGFNNRQKIKNCKK